MINPTFNYYEANIKRSTPLGSVTLDYFVNAIRTPKQNVKHTFEQIRIAEQNKDMAKKQELKSALYSFTPCVFVNGPRKYENILNWTGLLVLDFDHLQDPEYAQEFKEHLFNTYPFIVACWLSASQHGLRGLVKIPVCSSVVEFKHYFGAIQNNFKSYKGFDPAPKNCILPCFMSYDPKILHRENPTTWTDKYIPIEPTPVAQYIITDKTSSIEKIIFKRLDTITDSGHVILRATAYLLGGYVSAGYIDHSYSIDMIFKMIDAHHYLSQKASVYKKTAKEMINKGMSQPVYLENN